MRISILFIPLLFAACSPAPKAPEKTHTMTMANPASVYCVQIGGRSEIRTEAQGQVGYCHLPDGSVREEWALFRSAHTSH
ncbi:putative hemolysin [Neokomagataea anthophila]|uniref:DUF333 domain-containing protein n=1 Tax=Neokomagataea anthophila TaxID=2826925 RepID=A0ABS5E4G4_9PROT|nr:DUF333 domain-containing protein [Neokomagataea anthophila]MBR0558795.1 DUF333 domain-containing protein [Neokomagataea anthophila]